MPNLTRFKYSFQPCTLQGHVNDDAFFTWKNIELWNVNMWQGTIEEVLYYNYTTPQFLYVTTTLHNPPIIFMQHKGTSYRAEMQHKGTL
jgi:hypothetical protein